MGYWLDHAPATRLETHYSERRVRCFVERAANRAERAAILAAGGASGGNESVAAQFLCVSRATLYEKHTRLDSGSRR